MKHRTLKLLVSSLAGLIALAGLLWALTPSETLTIRVAADPQMDGGRALGFGPSKDSAAAGYMNQLARVSGLKFAYIPTRSREDSFRRLFAGEVDVVPTLLDVPQPVPSSAIAVSEPYYRGRTVIVTRTGSSFQSLAQLEGKRLAIRGGGEYEQWLRSHHPAIRLLTFSEVPNVLNAVESGVADAAIGTDAVYRPLLRRDYGKSLIEAGSVEELPIAVRAIVRRQDYALITRLDQGLTMLSAAQHAQVLEQWLDLAYRPNPSLTLLLRHYWLELLLGVTTALAMIFAIYQLRQSRRAAHMGEHEKARILAVMSHEIRNSANALQSAVDLLSRGTILDEQRSLIDAAVGSCSSLGLLLDNALEYSRLEAGQFVSSPVPCDVPALIDECLRAFGPQAEMKELRFVSSLPEGHPGTLLVDAVLLRQLLSNLASNAIKFTHHGSVVISAWASPKATMTPTLHIVVEDTGIGMDPGAVGRLFRPYSQLRGARSLGGAGLGLSICRDIVIRLGGEILVNSRIGQGSQFEVRLPVKRDASTPGRVEPLVSSLSRHFRERRVLLVEDHDYSARMQVLQLEGMGCIVTHAADGSSAKRAFEADGPFDTALLDCNLPDTTGYELATWIRSAEGRLGWNRAELVAISALRGPEHEVACREAGFDHVLNKPASRVQLQSLLGDHTAVDQAKSFLTMFWEMYFIDVEKLESAFAACDWMTGAKMAHRICGSAGIAGEREVESLSRELMHELDKASRSGIAPERLHERIANLRALSARP